MGSCCDQGGATNVATLQRLMGQLILVSSHVKSTSSLVAKCAVALAS